MNENDKAIDETGLTNFYKPENLDRWFNLENYQDAVNYKLEDWHGTLSFTSMVLRLATSPHTEAREFIKYCFFKVKTESEPQEKLTLKDQLEFMFQFSPGVTLPVVTPVLLCTLLEKLAQIKIDAAESGNLQLFENCIDYYLGRHDDIDKDSKKFSLFSIEEISKLNKRMIMDGSGSYLAHINLRATNKDIKEGLDNWLKYARKVTKENTRKNYFTRKDFKTWHEQALLPFLDLYLWDLMGSQTLTYAKYGHLLFPDDLERDTTELVRRTVKPKALDIAQWETVGILGRQLVNLATDNQLRQQKP